jgi:tetratricopeptide (TPR) repeat protein
MEVDMVEIKAKEIPQLLELAKEVKLAIIAAIDEGLAATPGDIRTKIEIKIENLEAVEKQYAKLLKELERERYVDKIDDRINHLITVFKSLAEIYTYKARLTKSPKDLTDAAIFYQYVAAVAEGGEDEYVAEKLELIQTELLETISAQNTPETTVAVETERNKAFLQGLRKDSRKAIDLIDKYFDPQRTPYPVRKHKLEAIYIEASRELFEHITGELKGFTARLTKECEEILGAPPCDYTLIGLGSMALQQMTPYSDLEFAILTASDDYRASDDPKVRNYFTNLSHLLHFKVINLGETVIAASKFKQYNDGFDLHLEHLVNRGFNFDLGGKTPLGRIGGDKDYELIGTAGQFVDRYLDEKSYEGYVKSIVKAEIKAETPDLADEELVKVVEGLVKPRIDDKLPFLLACVTEIYSSGQANLFSDYKEGVKAYLKREDASGLTNYQRRAIIVLSKEELGYEAKLEAFDLITGSVGGDIAKFAPRLSDQSDEGRLYDVKQEIYRLSDRLLYNLGCYFAIGTGISNWQVVDELYKMGVIGQAELSKLAPHHLKYALSFANNLRLQVYLHNNSQTEKMEVFAIDVGSGITGGAQVVTLGNFRLPVKDLAPGGRLFEYYAISVPFHGVLKAVIELQGKQSLGIDVFRLMSAIDFYDGSARGKGIIYRRLLQYRKSLVEFKQALTESPDNISVYFLYADMNEILGNYREAIKYYDKVLKAFHSPLSRDDCLDIAKTLNNMANIYQKDGDYEQALKFHRSALLKRKKLLPEYHQDIAASLMNIANVYNNQGLYKQALEGHNEALKMYQMLFPGDHPYVAGSFMNIANVYYNEDAYEQALYYYQKALTMQLRLFHKDHLDIAASLNNIANVYDRKGDYERSLYHYQQVLAMNRKLLSEKHPDIATSLMNIANIYQRQGNYKKALECYQEALTMMQQLLSAPHPDIAAALNNIASVYNRKGDYEQSLYHYQQALAMNRKLLPMEHPNIATSLDGIALVYRHLRDYEQALHYHQQALRMRKNLFPEGHSDIGGSLHNISLVYRQQDDYVQAIMYSINATSMSLKILGDEHPNSQIVLRGLAVIISKLAEENSFYDGLADEYFSVTRANLAIPPIQLQQYLAFQYINSGQLEKAVDWLRLVLLFAEHEEGAIAAELKILINSKLGCCYHIASMKRQEVNDEEKSAKYLAKADDAFQLALQQLGGGTNSGVHTEYASFLLQYGRYEEALYHLQKSISSGGDGKKLGYGIAEKLTLPTVLRQEIGASSDCEIELVASHYAYYLLITDYDKFVEVGGFDLEPLEAYIKQFRTLVEANVSVISYKLLGYAYQSIGAEELAQSAFEEAKELAQAIELSMEVEAGAGAGAGADQSITSGEAGPSTVAYVTSVEYDNPILNHHELIYYLLHQEDKGLFNEVVTITEGRKVIAELLLASYEEGGIPAFEARLDSLSWLRTMKKTEETRTHANEMTEEEVIELLKTLVSELNREELAAPSIQGQVLVGVSGVYTILANDTAGVVGVTAIPLLGASSDDM